MIIFSSACMRTLEIAASPAPLRLPALYPRRKRRKYLRQVAAAAMPAGFGCIAADIFKKLAALAALSALVLINRHLTAPAALPSAYKSPHVFILSYLTVFMQRKSRPRLVDALYHFAAPCHVPSAVVIDRYVTPLALAYIACLLRTLLRARRLNIA